MAGFHASTGHEGKDEGRESGLEYKENHGLYLGG